jgi:hypothetical protein
MDEFNVFVVFIIMNEEIFLNIHHLNSKTRREDEGALHNVAKVAIATNHGFWCKRGGPGPLQEKHQEAKGAVARNFFLEL